MGRFTQAGAKGSIAAFSDHFRYKVLSDGPGWWFDTDVLCLADASRYEELEQSVDGAIVGREDALRINGAVFGCTNPRIAKDLLQQAEAVGTEFEWGAIGPHLITSMVAARPSQFKVMDATVFYPVHYFHADWPLLPEYREQCVNAVSGSLSLHLWNEYYRRWRIPKELGPCAGSFLDDFLATEPASCPRISVDTCRALRDFGSMRAASKCVASLESKLVSLRRGARRWYRG
ncbi:MAG: hypothetical protein EON58_22450 [Alphaproteobacteria bacterium]|nr:MAG: hypothetical protein EON58_22450 [Alphaproteobacteria bacterium]